jgi:hypothetical protein
MLTHWLVGASRYVLICLLAFSYGFLIQEDTWSQIVEYVFIIIVIATP